MGTDMTPLAFYVLLFVAVGAGFVFVHLMAGKLIRPSTPDAEKGTIYECGEPTIGSAWVQFDLRYYVVALLFVIFDVEVAFFFPWAEVFGRANTIATQEKPKDAAGYNAYAAAVLDLSPPPTAVPGPDLPSELEERKALERKRLGALKTLTQEELDRARALAQKDGGKVLSRHVTAKNLPLIRGLTPEARSGLKKLMKDERAVLRKPTEEDLAENDRLTAAEREAVLAIPNEAGDVLQHLSAKDVAALEALTEEDWSLAARLTPPALGPDVPLRAGELRKNREAAGELAWLAFLEVLVFFGVLLVGFAYLWRRGDLAWVRSVTPSRTVEVAPPPAPLEQQGLVGAGKTNG
jgi:NADH-quinone oxidoreductase subunit A